MGARRLNFKEKSHITEIEIHCVIIWNHPYYANYANVLPVYTHNAYESTGT
jgi:superoxide dismutase